MNALTSAYADWALLALIGISLLIGFFRGFVKEVFALAVWVLAFLLAFYFADTVAGWIGEAIPLPSARTGTAFGVLFLAVLVAGALLTYVVGKLVEKTGLSGTDRLLGGIFGLLRGALLVLLLIILAGFTPVPQDPWWQESRVIQSMLPLSEWLAEFLPESVRDHFELYPDSSVAALLRTAFFPAMLESPAA